jgi:hypothetical protein
MHHSLNMDPTTLKGIELGDNAQIVRKKSWKDHVKQISLKSLESKKLMNVAHCCTFLTLHSQLLNFILVNWKFSANGQKTSYRSSKLYYI